jgi:hypothetical protein
MESLFCIGVERWNGAFACAKRCFWSSSFFFTTPSREKDHPPTWIGLEWNGMHCMKNMITMIALDIISFMRRVG